MADRDVPRTRLEQILRQRNLTLTKLREAYRQASGTEVSERQAYRWVAGQLTRKPYPHTRAALEQIFKEPADRLLGPPYGGDLSPGPSHRMAFNRGASRTDWEGQLISMSADRARNFLARIETTNIGSETIDQLVDDVRRLAVASQQRPFPLLLPDLVETQERAFTLLEGRQKPDQTRDLYLLAGIVSGFVAKASHDLGSPHDALTQARVAYACADNAGHDGLRAWIRGLQALVTYWSGRYDESVRYAQLGTEAAERSRGTASVWLASSEARSLAALNRLEETREAIHRADDARELVEHDELDELGSICTFSRATQLYYAADALVWGGTDEAGDAERTSLDALDALEAAPAADRGGFGNEQGAQCDLALARLLKGELEGATEAVAPVLEIPIELRQHGVVRSVERVQLTMRGLSAAADSSSARNLNDAIETFMAQRLALPQ